MVTSDVTATFDCDCRLSGLPDLTMYFNRPELMEDVAFHRCVRHKVSNGIVSLLDVSGMMTLTQNARHRRFGRKTNTFRLCRQTASFS